MTPDIVFRDPYMLEFLDLPALHSEHDLESAILREMERFCPAHKGQMEFYLRWLDRHDRAPGEEPPIGLILCAGADAEDVELMDLGNSQIRVAEYLAHIPDMHLLQKQLHHAVELARERAADRLKKQISNSDTDKTD